MKHLADSLLSPMHFGLFYDAQYGGFGVEGPPFPYHGLGADASHPNQGLSQCHGCATKDTVTPHASIHRAQAFANIEALRARYPDVYTQDGGFYDAVNPTTGRVGHRRLVLDQSMIMAALDNALNDRAMQRHFAADPVEAGTVHICPTRGCRSLEEQLPFGGKENEPL